MRREDPQRRAQQHEADEGAELARVLDQLASPSAALSTRSSVASSRDSSA